MPFCVQTCILKRVFPEFKICHVHVLTIMKYLFMKKKIKETSLKDWLSVIASHS
jgi:hypothetical protein